MSYIGTTEIGKMFLGNVEIDKAYLGSNLVFELGGSDAPGGSLSDYVQNGLLFHFDGKEKGNNAGKWTDVKNGYQYTNHGATFNSDHVYFDGVDDYLNGSSPSGTSIPTRTAGTVEVVIENENFEVALGVIFIPRQNARMGAAIQANKYFLYCADSTSGRAYICPIVTLSKSSFSISSARRYQNGVALSVSSDKTYLSGVTTSNNYIGRRNSGNYFKGKIYSIRMYTRQLTETEVMQNLSVDNIRFNLGLELE